MQEFANNTNWVYSEPFVNAPRCAEIIAAATGEVLNDDNITSILEGQKRFCLDLEFQVRNENETSFYLNLNRFQQNGLPSKGKICCCRGNDKCNEDIIWGDKAIQMADIEAYRKRHNIFNKASSSWVDSGLILLALFSAFLVLVL